MALTFDPDSHTYKIDGKPVPSVTQIVDYLNKGGFGVSDAIIRQAARRGSLVHEYCELIDYGAAPDSVEPELIGYVQAYQLFLRDFRPEWLYIEKQIGAESGCFAGTVDRIGRIQGKLSIVDIKTTSNFGRPEKIKLACQLAGYNILTYQLLGEAPQNLMGVQLKNTGKYTVHYSHSAAEKYNFYPGAMFFNLLEITRTMEGYE